MANLYWTTFRIAQIDDYDDRYTALESAIVNASGDRWWKEPTSFVLFESDLSIGNLARLFSSAINTDRDLVLIGMPNVKDARVIGNVEDDDLFKLLPFVKPA